MMNRILKLIKIEFVKYQAFQYSNCKLFYKIILLTE